MKENNIPIIPLFSLCPTKLESSEGLCVCVCGCFVLIFATCAQLDRKEPLHVGQVPHKMVSISRSMWTSVDTHLGRHVFTRLQLSSVCMCICVYIKHDFLRRLCCQ